MRSHIKIALLSFVGWGASIAPALANPALCPATLPEYEVVVQQPRFGGIASNENQLFSAEEIDQQNRFAQAIEQQGYEPVKSWIGTEISPTGAAYVLLGLTDSGNPPENAEVMVADAVTLLVEQSSFSVHRDFILFYLVRVADEQGYWDTATQAVEEIQDPVLRLNSHVRLMQRAITEQRSTDLQQQQQQASTFLNRHPSYRATLWAELAAMAQTINNPALATTLTEQTLSELAQMGDSAASDRIYAGSHRQVVIDQVARSLGQAGQFETAYGLLAELEGDAVDTQLAIATHQITAGEIDAALSRVLALADRSFHPENLAVVQALIAAGEIDCSIAVFLAPEVNGVSLRLGRSAPVSDPAQIMLSWAKAGRQDVMLSLGEDKSPYPLDFYISELMRPWAELGEWETALDLANAIPNPRLRYHSLNTLAEALSVLENPATAQVQALATELATTLDLNPTPSTPPRPNFSSGFSLGSGSVTDSPYNNIRHRLQVLSSTDPANLEDPDILLTGLMALQTELLERSASPSFTVEGMRLMAEVALAMYEQGYEEQAEQALQQTLTIWPQAFAAFGDPAVHASYFLPAPQQQDLLARYQAAGWYAGVGAWLTHPVLGHETEPNYFFPHLPLSEQGEAVWTLAQAAIHAGHSETALDLFPHLTHPAEQVQVGAMIATQVMMRRSRLALQTDPNAAFLQLDLLSDQVTPLANELPPDLTTTRAYLAIAEGYVALKDEDKAERWLMAAVDLMQGLD